MFTDVLILAGGFGERLWPASSPSFPKQFMSLEGGISFLQSAILRTLQLKITGKIIIVTRTDISHTVINQCVSLISQLDENYQQKLKKDLYIIAEPKPIHTAPPVALVCHLLHTIQPEIDHTMLVITSDHVIGPIDAFISDTEFVYEAANKDNIVCYAIVPTEPATGYGYIKMGKPLETVTTKAQEVTFKIEEFKEKPDLATAKKYLETGNYTWNSGMFGFKTKMFLSELEKCEPKIFRAFQIFAQNKKSPVFVKKNGINLLESWEGIEQAYEESPKESIDKAIAEKTKNSCAVTASFSWEDVGSWDSFEKLFTDHSGETASVEAENCFVYSDIPVALCGVNDLVVVIKNNKALVMKKGYSDKVKEAVHIFENEKK